MCRARQFSPALLILLMALGCGRSDRLPTTPTTAVGERLALETSDLHAEGAGSFYPLHVGNRWRYAETFKKVFIQYGHDTLVKEGEGRSEVVQVRMQEMHGRMYMREEIGIPDTVLNGGGVRWRREDRTGLYEYGTPGLGSTPSSETRLLAYPLHVGATWTMWESPPFRVTATVEGTDVLRFPAGRFTAWRIRISGSVPREQFVWYGRAGYLGMRAHDHTGSPTPGHIEIIYDEVETLTRLALVRPTP